MVSKVLLKPQFGMSDLGPLEDSKVLRICVLALGLKALDEVDEVVQGSGFLLRCKPLNSGKVALASHFDGGSLCPSLQFCRLRCLFSSCKYGAFCVRVAPEKRSSENCPSTRSIRLGFSLGTDRQSSHLGALVTMQLASRSQKRFV